MPERILLVSGAPVDPARLARVLCGPVPAAATVLAVAAGADPLHAVGEALRVFDPTRIVLAGPDPRHDVTGQIEDRFGVPVLAVAATACPLGALRGAE